MIRSFSLTCGALASGVLVALAGCVTGSGTSQFPAPIGTGVYTAGSVAPGVAGYHDENYQRSIRFCFDQGKQLVRVDPAGAPVTTRSQGEVLFRCAAPGEPGWKEPAG